MPVIEGDPEDARERLEAAGVEIDPGNTGHERWRAEYGNSVAVAYESKVVLQGNDSSRLRALLLDADGGRAFCYFDGASRGNPGPAAIGWAIVDSSGIVAEGGARIDATTNNRAEYEALLEVLELASEYGFGEIEIRGDSELIIKQVRGEYDTNSPELRERRVAVREQLREFEDWSIEHVPREVNERADALANEALDDE